MYIKLSTRFFFFFHFWKISFARWQYIQYILYVMLGLDFDFISWSSV